MSTWRLVLVCVLLGGGCSEYGLSGQSEPAGGAGTDTAWAPDGDAADTADTAGDSGGSATDTECPDTGSAEARVELSAAEADPEAAEPVCSALGVVDFSMRERWSVRLPGFAMAPLVAPNLGRPGASVIVDSDHHLLELSGQDGTVLSDTLIIPEPGAADDGSTPAVADIDGDGDADVAAPTWGRMRLVDLGTGALTTFEMAAQRDDEMAIFADIDLDGDAEVLTCSGVYRLDGTPLVEQAEDDGTETFVMDLDGDGYPDWVNRTGIWDPRDGTGGAFPRDLTPEAGFYGVPLGDGAGGGAVGFVGRNTEWAVVAAGGTELSRVAGTDTWGLAAVGDVDGDGEPDVVRIREDEEELVVTDAEGVEKQAWPFGQSGLWGGGVSLADLDADGAYEIILLTTDRLYILDGASGDTLGRYDVGVLARDSAPAIADVDGDGSAEIVVVADWIPNMRVVVLGPATGRWARTRPIWNQLAYDAASVHDDGTLVRLGTPGWQGLQAFRAQPGRDGELPDLAVSLSATAAEVCEEAGESVEVLVRNLGSTEAPAGARLRLQAWDGAARQVLYDATLPAIPPGSRVVLTWVGPLEAQGLLVDVEAVGQECDPLDDHAELLPL